MDIMDSDGDETHREIEIVSSREICKAIIRFPRKV